jgi:hypothetical protein
MLTMRFRTGRKVGRTIYMQRGPEPRDSDELCGVMDSPNLAKMFVDAMNKVLEDADRLISENLREVVETPSRPLDTGRTVREAEDTQQSRTEQMRQQESMKKNMDDDEGFNGDVYGDPINRGE